MVKLQQLFSTEVVCKMKKKKKKLKKNYVLFILMTDIKIYKKNYIILLINNI